MDGLIVGLDMMCKFIGTKRYRKKIYLITDGEKPVKYEREELDEIVKTVRNNNIQLNCLTMDFLG